MESDYGFDTFGGAHLFDSAPESFERLRGIKTAEAGNAKWVASTSLGTDAWANGVNGTSKPIAQAAVDARGKMQANFAAATQPGGKWERRLLARGDGYIKSQAVALKQNYADGVRNASAKQLASLRKIIAYETSALTQLTPRSAPGSGRTRMNEWFDLMSAGAGTLGAAD